MSAPDASSDTARSHGPASAFFQGLRTSRHEPALERVTGTLRFDIADGSGRAEQGGAEQGRAEQGRAEHGRAEHGRAEQGRAEQGRAEHGRAEHGRAEQGRAEQGRAARGRAERWLVTIDKGELTSSRVRGKQAADCTVRADREVIDRVVEGRANPFAALLRGAMEAEGDLGLLIRFQRLLPAPTELSKMPAKARAGR